VLATEAEALWSLGTVLDQSFVAAVDMLLATKGRIIVCGLGKSGHIARKIAATLAATGSPACFLHAGEAMHGDLGVIIAADSLLILSNSGDTREFGAILRRAELLAVPVIAMTSNPGSPLAEAADICLLLPAIPEVCRYGSSPTTSTTMMLALGDALAVAAMQVRDVQAEDLRRLHPGGRLGLDLVVVDSFMHRGGALPLVAADMGMQDVLSCIAAGGFGVAGVIDDHERLIGVITDGDIRRHAFMLSGATAADVMTTRPRTLFVGAVARDALAILSEARITSLFVIDNAIERRVMGLIHIHDLLRLGIG
jgi:arabinose-5-phosphate isomerase